MTSEIISENSVDNFVDCLVLLTESNITDETLDEVIDMTFSNVSEELILEVSAAFQKRAAQKVLSQRKEIADRHKDPIGLSSLRDVPRKQARYEHAKEIATRKISNPSNSSDSSPIGLAGFKKSTASSSSSSSSHRSSGSTPAHDIMNYAKTAGSLGNSGDSKKVIKKSSATTNPISTKVDSEKVASKEASKSNLPAVQKTTSVANTGNKTTAVGSPSNKGELTIIKKSENKKATPLLTDSKAKSKKESPKKEPDVIELKKDKDGVYKAKNELKKTVKGVRKSKKIKTEEAPKSIKGTKAKKARAPKNPSKVKTVKAPTEATPSKPQESPKDNSALKAAEDELKKFTDSYKGMSMATHRNANDELWKEYVAGKKRIRDRIASLKSSSANEAYSSAIALIATMDISEALFLDVINELKINKEECDKAVNTRYNKFLKAANDYDASTKDTPEKMERYNRFKEATQKYAKLANFVDKRYEEKAAQSNKEEQDRKEPKIDIKFKKVL